MNALEYDLPEIQAADLTDDNVRESFLSALQRVKDDDCFVAWFRDSLLPECVQLLKQVDGDDLEAVSALGNLSDSIERLAELTAPQEDGEIWTYDCIFQFAEEVGSG